MRVRLIRTGRPLIGELPFGFTVAVSLIALTAVALPVYHRVTWRAKESELRCELFAIRQMIHEYGVEQRKAPQTLDELVSKGYLNGLPRDPMTGNSIGWRTIAKNTGEAGIEDVRSGSDRAALDGTPYASW